MIEVRGAREHNLRAVDLDLPRGKLIVLCGVSGSGKSSLAIDTLHVEGQRRYLEALALARPGLPQLVPPRVDRVDGLPPTLSLVQRAGPPGPRSTVGTLTEVDGVLRVLFGRAGTAHCPVCGRPIRPVTHDQIVAALVALPEGTRLTLEAPVRVRAGEEERPVRTILAEIERAGFSRIRVGDRVVRIDEVEPGLRVPRGGDPMSGLRVVVDRIRIEPDRRTRLYDSVRTTARAGSGVVIAVHDGGPETPGDLPPARPTTGPSPDRAGHPVSEGQGSGGGRPVGRESRRRYVETAFVDRPYCAWDDLRLPELEPRLLGTWGPPGACPDCHGTGRSEDRPCPTCEGTRLSASARAVRWHGLGFAELQRVPLRRLVESLGAPEGPVDAAALAAIAQRVHRAEQLGLGHLALRDPADRLSSSEIQRLRLIRQVASPLSGVLYVLDEPTAGLDGPLVDAVVGVLRELVAAGNTVLAVEHHPAVIRAADHAVEFGPGAGVAGGRVVFHGDPADLPAADTPTGRWLSGRETLEGRSAPGKGEVTVRGRWRHGSDGPPVALPRGVVAAVSGAAGSGKSALLEAIGAALGGTAEGVELDGATGLTRPILAERGAARAARSTPATYVGLWDVVRELLASTGDAAVRGLSASAFSLNAPGGRCEACKGTGEQLVELGPLPDLVQTCPVCEGRRFQQDVLEVRWKGLNAAELLAMPADEARPVLAGHPRLEEALRALVRVGLGYVPLGQPVHTLSGGEARRLVLARELARAHRRGADDTVYLLDDPTVGLHPQDTAVLVRLLRELTDEGATVWVATVDPLLIGAADRVVRLADLGTT